MSAGSREAGNARRVRFLVTVVWNMKLRNWIVGIVLAALVAAAIVGMVWTRALPAVEDSSALRARSAGAEIACGSALVDQRPLQTAQRMAAMAGTPEEQALAHEAEKVGDHEVDLAFFDALRTAQQNPPPLSPEAKQIAARKTKAEQTLKDDQDNIAQLTRKLATAPDAQKDNLQDQIDVAKAQMDLDQDELDDAAEDLEQAGGDPQSKIKRLQAEHEAGDHNVAGGWVGASNPHEQDYQAHTLLSVFRAWQALREKRRCCRRRGRRPSTKQELFEPRSTPTWRRRSRKTRRIARRRSNRPRDSPSNTAKPASREDSKASAKSALDSLKQYTLDQKNLADLRHGGCRTSRN